MACEHGPVVCHVRGEMSTETGMQNLSILVGID